MKDALNKLEDRLQRLERKTPREYPRDYHLREGVLHATYPGEDQPKAVDIKQLVGWIEGEIEAGNMEYKIVISDQEEKNLFPVGQYFVDPEGHLYAGTIKVNFV